MGGPFHASYLSRKEEGKTKKRKKKVFDGSSEEAAKRTVPGSGRRDITLAVSSERKARRKERGAQG